MLSSVICYEFQSWIMPFPETQSYFWSDSFKANLKFQNCIWAPRAQPLFSFETASDFGRNLETKAKELFALFKCSIWQHTEASGDTGGNTQELDGIWEYQRGIPHCASWSKE